VVTGSMGDEAAVDCIKQGAADFVLKDRPARLPVAIQQALEERRLREERKHAEGTLRVSEIRYRRLFEAAHDGILILDADSGEITDVNPFLTNLLGFSKAELLGKKLWEIGPLRDVFLSKAEFLELQTKGYVRYENLPLQTKAGKRVAVEFVSNVYLAGDQKVIQCNIRDITVRKRAEAERMRLMTAIEQAAEGVVVTDAEGGNSVRQPGVFSHDGL
jgi:PAS domain S-box-containing protein